MEQRFIMLPISVVRPSPDNVRRSVGDVTELAASIKANGILEPIIVVRDGDAERYLIVAGERRYAGAKRAGCKEVPAIVRDFDERGRVEAMVVENLQRENLSPLEEADGMQRLIKVGGYSQKTLASRIGVSQSHVSKRLSLLRLPTSARSELDSGGISVQDALELVRLAEHPENMDAAVAETKRYGNAKRAVDEAFREMADAATLEAARKGLQRQNIAEIPWPQHGQWLDKARPIGIGFQALAVDAKRHRSEPCHAAAISDMRYSHPKLGTVVPVCTDPSRHAAKGVSALKVSVKESSAEQQRKNQERAHEKALRQVRVARSETIAAMLSGALPKKETTEHIVRVWARHAGSEVARIAAGMLGIEGLPTSWGGTDHVGALLKRLDDKPSEVIRVGLGLALAQGELMLRGSYPNWEAAIGHIDFLTTRVSYKPSAEERKALKAARADLAARRATRTPATSAEGA